MGHCILITDIYLVQTCTSQACRLYLHNTDHCWNIPSHRCIVDTEVWICCRTFCHHSLRFWCTQPRIRQQKIFLSTRTVYISSLHSPKRLWFALNIKWVYRCFVPITIHTQVHSYPSSVDFITMFIKVPSTYLDQWPALSTNFPPENTCSLTTSLSCFVLSLLNYLSLLRPTSTQSST